MNIDVIGHIYTGGSWDEEGNQLTAPTLEAGYHVNTTELPTELEQYAVTPATPRRVFAGVKTYFLMFADEPTFKAAMAQWLPTDGV